MNKKRLLLFLVIGASIAPSVFATQTGEKSRILNKGYANNMEAIQCAKTGKTYWLTEDQIKLGRKLAGEASTAGIK